MTVTADDARRMTAAERLAIIEVLWNSLVDEGDHHLPVTESQRELLDARLADMEIRPDANLSWDEARSRALASLRR